jgi:peptidoglycan/LPS O-acetylase OafA/YrhL
MGLIRFLLACFVVLFHCGQFDSFVFMQGPTAVQIFYVISGFYMAMILNEKYINKANSYWLFISNRLLKLIPIYWLLLVLILGVSIFQIITTNGIDWALLKPYRQSNLGVTTWLYLIFTNITMVGQDVSLFMGLNQSSGSLFFTSNYQANGSFVYLFLLVPQAWTISIELLFYFIAPFICRQKVWVVAAIGGLSFGLKQLLVYKGFNFDPWTYRFFPSELFYFIIGILSYKAYVWLKNKKVNKYITTTAFVGTASLILGFQFLMLQFHQALFFAAFSVALPFVFIATKKSSIDRYIGEYSYPIYISHVFFKFIYYKYIGTEENSSLWVLLLSIVFSALYLHFIYKKLEAVRQKRVVAPLV